MINNIHYKTNIRPEISAIIAVYESSGINRPINEVERIQKMYEHANLIVSAWVDDELIGIARSLTDFAYCCYLSDLAVKAAYQKMGVGKQLIERTKAAVGDQSMLLLLSAPEAIHYYPKVGFQKVKNGFILLRSK